MESTRFPKSMIDPITQYLLNKQRQLLKRKASLTNEDPFTDPDRINDNAAVDAEAAEQFGHANVAAMKKEVERMLVRIKKTLTQIKIGKFGICEGCGKMIETERLTVNPTAQFCITCENNRNPV